MTTPKKSLGQHWLHDQAALQAMCQLAELSEEDHVLEIGPGLGTLTEQLLLHTPHITAVEYDADLAKQLQHRLPDVSIVHQDILQFDFATMPSGYKVVANIPYYLTSHLIRRLLEASNQPKRIVLLVQKEVAQRITATPGSMSILSVLSQLYADVQLGNEVPAELFQPPPKVDSQMLVLIPKKMQPDIQIKRFSRIVKAGFGERRKKLANSLAGGLHLPKLQIENKLAELGLDQSVRAQELSLDDWYKLYTVFSDTIEAHTNVSGGLRMNDENAQTTGSSDDPAVADDQQNLGDEQSLLDKVKNAIPGDMDDKLIDGAQSAVSGAASKADDVVNKVTDAIPGEFDDKLVDNAKRAVEKAGDMAEGAVDKLKDMNPMGGSDDKTPDQS